MTYPPATSTESLRITDPEGRSYSFRLLLRSSGGRDITTNFAPMQPGEARVPWRIPLHNWEGGVMRDRIVGRNMTYHSANADLTNGILVPPPKINKQVLPGATKLVKAIPWDNKIWILGGAKLWSVDANMNFTEEKDLQTDYGAEGVDMAVFNDKLYVALGESVKMVERDKAGTWTQATDNVYAIALGVVGERLWRAVETHKITSCLTNPLAEASWNPLPSAQGIPLVGDSTWPVHTILDYGGVPWAFKGDGAYQPDPNAKFYNQVPQMRQWPHADNGRGAFTAMGYLWIPTIFGIVRVAPGEAPTIGWELAERGHSGLRVWTGVEWRGEIWFVCTDDVDGIFLVRMERDRVGTTGRPFVWHQLASNITVADNSTQISSGSRAFAIVSAYTSQPTLIFGQGWSSAQWIKLSSGGSRDIDDPNYEYGTSFSMITGSVVPGEDQTVEHVLYAIEATLDADSSETFEFEYAVEPAHESVTTWKKFQASAVGAVAQEMITNTNGYTTVRRYALPNTVGRRFSVRVLGSCDASSGTDRPELRELWLLGYARPKRTDLLQVTVYGGVSYPDGSSTARWSQESYELFRKWASEATPLKVELAGVPQDDDDYWLVADAQVQETHLSPPPAGRSPVPLHVITVTFTRVSYGS